MSLIEKVKERGNVIDNRRFITTGDCNENDYEEIFRMLTGKIVKMNITEAKKKYGIKGKQKFTLENLLSLCMDNSLSFEADAVLMKFTVHHQAEGELPMQFDDGNIKVSEVEAVEVIDDKPEVSTVGGEDVEKIDYTSKPGDIGESPQLEEDESPEAAVEEEELF